MKKSIRNLLILLVVAALLAGLYLIISSNEDPAATGVLYRLGSGESVETVNIANRYGSFAFKEIDGAWMVTSTGTYRTNPEKMKLILASLENFEISRVLEKDQTIYGLDDPEARIVVKTNKGNEYRFSIGYETASRSSVYVRDEASGKVMIASTSTVAQLTGSLDAYRSKDVLTVDPDNIRSIAYYEHGQLVLQTQNTDYKNWSMSYPYAAPARKVILTELVAKMREWTIASYPDETLAPADMGLDKPVCALILTDGSGDEQLIEFGTTDGTTIYVRTGGQDVVKLYVTDTDFSKLTPEGVMYVAPLNADLDSVASIEINIGGKAHAFVLSRVDEETMVKLDGKDIPYEQFISVYFKYIALSADGYKPQADLPGEAEMVFTTRLTNGQAIELRLVPGKDDELFMVVKGKADFYFNRSSLEQLLYRFNKALDTIN